MFEKATRGDFCKRHYVGELIDMKFLDGSKTILSPNESVVMEMISSALLGLMGAGISVLQWRKMQSLR